MTDVPTWRAAGEIPVPGRLGASALLDERGFVVELTPTPHVLHLGAVRASVMAYVVDVLAGVPMDAETDDWTLTTDLSVRATPAPAPERVIGTQRTLRRGRRSTASHVELVATGGDLLGTGVAGFAIVPRKPDDPPKFEVSIERLTEFMRGDQTLDRDIREAAGVKVVHAEAGVVELPVTPLVQNPAGTLQGAMVALVAEVAAEEMVATRCGREVFVTDLDIRYLARSGDGPVTTRARMVGDGPAVAVEVEIVDTSTGTVTTHVYARTTPLD